MTWFSAGTVQVASGSSFVVGTGTTWIENARPGNAIMINGSDRLWQIEAVVSDTDITLAEPFDGASAAGVAYSIVPIRGEIAEAYQAMLALRQQVQAQVDAFGAALQFIDDDLRVSSPLIAAQGLTVSAGGITSAAQVTITSGGLDLSGGSLSNAAGAGLLVRAPATLTVSGTHQFSSLARFARIIVQGAGGGGGGASQNAAGIASPASGGGAGGRAIKWIDLSTLTQRQAILTIGAPGAGGLGLNNGADAGSTQCVLDNGVTVVANGGGGGKSASPSTTTAIAVGAFGGSASGGDQTSVGARSENGLGFGSSISSFMMASSSSGGGSAYSGASGPRGVRGNTGGAGFDGFDAFGFGGGGGGAAAIGSGGTNYRGGAGSAGCVEIWEFG